jgi:putative transposase
MRETLHFTGKIMSVTVSRVANKWFVSITVDTLDDSCLPKTETQGVVGVDLGIMTLATLSTGECVVGSKAHKVLLQRLRRISRDFSRKMKRSKN